LLPRDKTGRDPWGATLSVRWDSLVIMDLGTSNKRAVP